MYQKTLLGSPWPQTAELNDAGVVSVGGLELTELAQRFQTPLYVLDEADFVERAQKYLAAMQSAFAEIGSEVEVSYAAKAFISKHVVKLALANGLNIDTASFGEMSVALAAGAQGHQLGLHGNKKSDEELTLAIENNFARIFIDSLVEIERVASLATKLGRDKTNPVPVMVRVTTGVHAGGHEYIATAHEDQKFGLSVNAHGSEASVALQALTQILQHPQLKLVCIHSHIGSQILDSAGFIAAAERVLQLRAALASQTGTLVPEIDLGGGFGVAYLPSEVAIDLAAASKELAQAVKRVCEELKTPVPALSFEPGRAIVGPAMVSIYRVGTIKEVSTEDGQKRLYVSLDGGMSDNIRPALYDANYFGQVVSRKLTGKLVPARVVGKHCESGDILIHNIELPQDIAAGDLFAIPVTGAYGRAMSSNYNYLPRPGVVAVKDGVAHSIVRRETIADLLALDLG